MELISKEEVLKIIEDAVERINDLPMIFLGEEFVCDTVTAWNKGYMAGQNDRPKGKWIDTSGYNLDDECSNCGYIVLNTIKADCNYCPHCGAKMEEE